MTERTIGFIGLGAMGLPMASRLAGGGHRVLGVDAFPAAVDRATAAGLPSSTDLGSLAGVDALVVAVATGAQLLDLLGSAPLTAGTSVRLVIVVSTVGRDAVERFAAALEAIGVPVVDSPMTGGVAGAERGALQFFVAASEDAAAAAAPILDPMGTVVRAGEAIGDGQALKLVNQVLAVSHIAIAGEALAFARALGIDPGLALQAVRAGAAGSFMLDDRGPRMVADPAERPVVTRLAIIAKDAALVDDAATAIGFDAAVLRAARDAFDAAVAMGLAEADDSSVTDIDRSR